MTDPTPTVTPPQRVSLLLLAAFATACSLATRPAQRPTAVDDAAIREFWRIQDALAEGVELADDAWQPMFDTTAYRWLAARADQQQRIRQRMRIAFQPDRSQVLDWVAAADGYEAVLRGHYLRMRDERRELEAWVSAMAQRSTMTEAMALARQHLPAEVPPEGTPPPPVYLALWGPDAFGDDAVYVDALKARDLGEHLPLLVAHEFHHVFYTGASPLPELPQEHESYWLLHTLRQLHLEGLADRIDKKSYPIASSPGDTAGYAANFNRYYDTAPRTLRSFDAALRTMAREPERVADLARKAWGLFHYGAHPEGFFMANTVAAALGPRALLADVGDPFAFVRRFHSVTASDPVFSDEAMEFLARIEASLRDAQD